ncbi:ribokinase [Salimicrobium album]|uniref:Ribokinase n=1 Tax=Salimicrobium album TaxID=50717 RepID=A0A1H3IJH5_9BACI|nr:ribokinase [Salimicrobium album]SDY27860.1 ribokinase [Salimicrobium album]
MKRPAVTVIGSINVDMITKTTVVPDQGETVLGDEFHIKSGGKGANQAIAAARLGAEVSMIGRVGKDAHGEDMLRVLEKESINTAAVEKTDGVHTGVANIIVSNNDNRITIVPGANNEVSRDYVRQFEKKIASSDIVLLQFEIPLETVMYCLEVCEKHDVPVIVNPAPARDLPDDYWKKADYITPNESEAAQLFSEAEISGDLADKLVITKGEAGVSYSENGESVTVPSYPVTPIDTTGAGDTFNGALAVALAENESMTSAVKFANAASALSIQKFGAQEGMPGRNEIHAFLNDQ